ncbi:MAG: response regulator [Chloroflexota bacterium]
MKVIYIEDNAFNFRLVKRMLRSYDITGSATGAEGLQMVIDNIPDVLLLDINLPDMDGFEVLKRIRANAETQDIPVIAVTANAMHGDRENILASGFDGYIAKPLTRLELENTITRVTASV